jgi:hypothetical protein
VAAWAISMSLFMGLRSCVLPGGRLKDGPE